MKIINSLTLKYDKKYRIRATPHQVRKEATQGWNPLPVLEGLYLAVNCKVQ